MCPLSLYMLLVRLLYVIASSINENKWELHEKGQIPEINLSATLINIAGTNFRKAPRATMDINQRRQAPSTYLDARIHPELISEPL